MVTPYASFFPDDDTQFC